jgi:hypothetical protein
MDDVILSINIIEKKNKLMNLKPKNRISSRSMRRR